MQGQSGSTLIELLVAIPIAIALLGIAVDAMVSASTGQQDIERRTEALDQGQIGMERMTRDIRQAAWVYFRSSSVVDIGAKVRTSTTARATVILVRYDCSGEVCTRAEGGATAYPPPALPALGPAQGIIGASSTDVRGTYAQIIGHDIFTPQSIDPATGVVTTDFANPNYLAIHIQMSVKNRVAPVMLDDGVDLRNLSEYKP